jgi:hypothetical protein
MTIGTFLLYFTSYSKIYDKDAPINNDIIIGLTAVIGSFLAIFSIKLSKKFNF